jgi:hypothetical protein
MPETYTTDAPAPVRFRDYRDTGATVGAGRRIFHRLKSLGAFNSGSPLQQYNPFLAEGQQDWQNNPLHQFTGPGRKRPTIPNTMSAISAILDQEKAPHQAAYTNLMDTIGSGAGALNAQRDAVMKALGTDVIPPALLERLTAGSRERIAREGAQTRVGLSAQLAGSGGRVDQFDPAYGALQNETLYKLGQSEIDNAMTAATTNRQGQMDAIGAAGAYGGSLAETIKSLLSAEEFRSQLSKDQITMLEAMAGLRKAGQ